MVGELLKADPLPGKNFKDVFCQTENPKEFCEDNREQVEESDRESGVHVFSYSSNAPRIFSGNTKPMESSSSQSTDMSDDSNYCDDTCSDGEGSSISESSEINSVEQTDGVSGINKLQMVEKHSPRQEINKPIQSSFKNTLAPSNSDLSDVECTSSEICSTCNSDTCSCNSCYECQENNIFIVKQTKSETEEETSESNSCSCSSEECTCNKKEIDLEEQNNLDGSSIEVNSNADVNNNTVVTIQEENIVDNRELPDEEHATAESNNEELKDEDTIKRPVLSHQLTTESWDSQVVDEETQILSIHEAAKNGDLQVVELLSKVNRKYIETVDERGWTPIHLAAANGHTEIVKFLALEGAHISALDPSGYTALHIAAMKGHKGCLEALLEAEADVECITSDGFTPLHLAALNNHISCCKILLAWGASLKKEDALGRTVVDMAEEYSLKRVKKLLQNFNKQLENFNNIVDTMETFSGKKRPKSNKALPRNVLYLLTSVMTDEYNSN